MSKKIEIKIDAPDFHKTIHIPTSEVDEEKIKEIGIRAALANLNLIPYYPYNLEEENA